MCAKLTITFKLLNDIKYLCRVRKAKQILGITDCKNVSIGCVGGIVMIEQIGNKQC